ncbi:MAG: SET domain-containing protein [Cyclobacteriaceae bacterium]
MALLEKHLYVKRSGLPGAGKGLFTRIDIKKGTRIVEYKGTPVTWKEVEKMADDRNGYVFFFNNRYCIDAWTHRRALGRYANDARGLTRVEGLTNNGEYDTEKRKCFIKAIKDIPAGSEIFVGYGAEYWQVIRYNIRLDQKNKAKRGVKSGKVELPHHKLAKRQSQKH